MARVNVTSWLVVLLCCAVFVAIVGQSGISQTTATLSEARYQLAATSLGDLVFFGGGNNATGPSDRVDIYDVTSGIWTAATLSVPRFALAAASAGNLVFFAGGCCYSAQVDIYNMSNGSWNTASLSQARAELAATSVGNLVLFGGGCCDTYGNFVNVVDIYNVPSNTWTTATLSQARGYLAATSVANRYVLFAGGCCPSNVVDIFDSLYGMWNAATLSWSRTIEDGVHTADIFHDGVSAQLVGTRDFAKAVIARLGEEPTTLPKVHYPASEEPIQIRLTERPLQEKTIDGIDIFVEWHGSVAELAERLEAHTTDRLRLVMISNRGQKVYPGGAPETFCVDHWRCRFQARQEGTDLTTTDLIEQLTRLCDAGLPFVKTEGLFRFDGTPGYSLGQGQ
jgi:hypothetical protein